MKVYIVYGCLDRENECDRHVYGCFDSYEKAEDYAIKISREAFDNCRVSAKHREYAKLTDSETVSYNGQIMVIMDNENYIVEVYIDEREVQ